MQHQRANATPTRIDPADVRDETIAARARHVGYVELEGQGVCYDPANDDLHVFNPAAGAIWTYLDGQTSLAEIAADLADVFSADESIVRDSMLTTVADFAEKGLVTHPQPDLGSDHLTSSSAAPSSPRLLTDPPGG